MILVSAFVLPIHSRGICAPPAKAARVPIYGYRVVNVYPHDPGAFTQGLVYFDGFLYESTGLNGRSTVRKVRIETGEVLQQYQLDPRYFGEGLARVDSTLVQLTWTSGIGFLYDLVSFKTIGTFRYRGEGWGLACDGKRVVMSDGSSTLRFLDPATFKETRRLSVTEQGRPVARLNELEFVRGEIYANVWQTDRIAVISPRSGRVTGWIDLHSLAREARGASTDDVLNGIAYDARHDRLFVTGKLWAKLFEIKIVREH